VGHQDSDGEPRKYAQQRGGLIQFRVQESDFESNSEFRTHLAFKLTYMTCLTSDLGDLHMHGKIMR
jgi:hypothetical protein